MDGLQNASPFLGNPAGRVCNGLMRGFISRDALGKDSRFIHIVEGLVQAYALSACRLFGVRLKTPAPLLPGSFV